MISHLIRINSASFKNLCIFCLFFGQTVICTAQKKTIDQKVDSVLRLMTLDEKIGQMNQYNGDWAATGPITKDGDKQNQIQEGNGGLHAQCNGCGSYKNIAGNSHAIEIENSVIVWAGCYSWIQNNISRSHWQKQQAGIWKL